MGSAAILRVTPGAQGDAGACQVQARKDCGMQSWDCFSLSSYKQHGAIALFIAYVGVTKSFACLSGYLTANPTFSKFLFNKKGRLFFPIPYQIMHE
ncbi:MAG: hypothetical protein NMNS01_06710 [Nitrosomonas sp.]|nr:MAG: hypothetical protein NMNS01_06710 [Nitrosomonas sp.]